MGNFWEFFIHLGKGALHAPGSISALWRTGLMLQSSRGQGMGQLAAENLEKKIPLVTRRSSRRSSVIGLEVWQVDQGKRVLVQYIFYNLIISVFNDWCIRKIYRFIRFSACFDSHSAVCILWQGACLVQCPQTAGSLRTSPAVSLIPAIIS